MGDDSYVKNKTKEEILSDLYTTAQPGTVVHEQQKMAIIVRCTQDIERAIHEHSASTNSLGDKVLWLNVALTFATIIGAVATLFMAYAAFFPGSP